MNKANNVHLVPDRKINCQMEVSKTCSSGVGEQKDEEKGKADLLIRESQDEA